MGFFADLHRKKLRSKAWDEAYACREAKDFAGAAKVYEKLAEDTKTWNVLIYADDCHDAVLDWTKAGNPDKAMENARNGLLALADTDWFPNDDAVEKMCGTVGELYAAGFHTASDKLANEFNAVYLKHKMQPRFQVKARTFPTECPNCGGTLPETTSDVSITCPHCGTVVRAV